MIVPALRDPDSEVRAAAAEALVRAGRQAIAPMIELLGSAEPADQARAARVLAKMGAESKAALPALVRVLGVSDDGVQDGNSRARRGDGTRRARVQAEPAEAVGQIAQALAIRKDRSSLTVLRAALRAEENASLGLATIGPLREAIGFLEARGPKHRSF